MDVATGVGKRLRALRSTGIGCWLLVAVTFGSGPAVTPLQAQMPDPGSEDVRDRPLPSWVGHFTVLGANAVVGGLTAGIGQHLRGGSFTDGFTRGFLGGSVVYAGKRIAAEDFAGAGVLGRSIAATGGSMVRNASDRVGTLDRVVLPIGPVRFYIDRDRLASPRLKVDLVTVVTTGYALTRSELEFDIGRSLSAGAPVFRAPGHRFDRAGESVRSSGKVVGNVLFLSDLEWVADREAREVFAHERVHILQRDQVFVTLTEPLSAAIADRLPGGSALYRYIDVHATDLVFIGLGRVFSDYYDRPWELEAFRLSGHSARP